MKKTVIMLVAMVSAGVSMAQQSVTKKPAIEKVTPPAVVLDSFKAKLSGDYLPVWSKSAGGNFIAAIENNNVKQFAEFSPEGKWISTATLVAFDQLSEAAQKKIKEQYAEMQVTEVKKIERDGVSAFYKVKLTKDKESKTVYVNDAGFVSE